MGKCILCEGDTSWIGVCKHCGLRNKLSKRKKDFYEFVFEGNKKLMLPVEKNLDIVDFVNNNRQKVHNLIKEQDNLIKEQDNLIKERKKEQEILNKEREMAAIGYYKGKMCPFTQVKIGGTTNVSSAVLFGAPTTDQYTWTHSECLEEYCAIWDSKGKQCSIKKIAEKLK
ncbi:MAG: hypothetical protein NT001_07520 [Candidatus Woesearchaeota archaeon]|nr:hypothetical protein [Candidatus Woesearchaeota archaeon]